MFNQSYRNMQTVDIMQPVEISFTKLKRKRKNRITESIKIFWKHKKTSGKVALPGSRM